MSETWRVGSKVSLNVYDEADSPVCQCHTAEDAALIVRAVNSHEELLEALKRHAKGLRNLVELRLVPASHFPDTIMEAEHTERLIARAEDRS